MHQPRPRAFALVDELSLVSRWTGVHPKALGLCPCGWPAALISGRQFWQCIDRTLELAVVLRLEVSVDPLDPSSTVTWKIVGLSRRRNRRSAAYKTLPATPSTRGSPTFFQASHKSTTARGSWANSNRRPTDTEPRGRNSSAASRISSSVQCPRSADNFNETAPSGVSDESSPSGSEPENDMPPGAPAAFSPA